MTKVDVSQCPDYKTRLYVSSPLPYVPRSLAFSTLTHIPVAKCDLTFVSVCVCVGVDGVCRKKLVDSKEELAKLTGCWPLALHYCTSN